MMSMPQRQDDIACQQRPRLHGAWPTRALLLPLLAAGCVSVLAQNGPAALKTAQTRGQFELNCQQVETTVLSQKTVEGVRFEGSEHTIGVRGCGRQVVYVVFCRDPNDCNALAQTSRPAEVAP
jgi:hypothetical protein